jgi:hypothetical protein
MSDDTKNLKNTKHLFKIAGMIGLIITIAGAAAGGYSYGSKGANLDTTTNAAEVNEVRNTITIEENAEGEILINGVGFEPNGIVLSEGRIFLERSFRVERVPINCTETMAAMRVLMNKGDTAAVLNRDGRYEFELLNVLAKDVCSYEEYRNMLVAGLSEFLYTTPGTGAAEETTETTVPGKEPTVPDEAGDQPTTTAPENQ